MNFPELKKLANELSLKILKLDDSKLSDVLANVGGNPLEIEYKFFLLEINKQIKKKNVEQWFLKHPFFGLKLEANSRNITIDKKGSMFGLVFVPAYSIEKTKRTELIKAIKKLQKNKE